MKENSKSLKEQKVSEINNIEMIKKHPRMLSKITDEMKNDIISGMKQKDFVKKYSLSKQTYLNYKNLLIPEYEQDFNLKIDRKEFHEFIKTHNKYEVMLKYHICNATYYNSLKFDREHFDELE